MEVIKLRVLLLLFIAVTSLRAASEILSFDGYRVSELDAEELIDIDFISNEKALSLRSKLDTLIGKKANFAGNYILQPYGCGSMCQGIMVVNVKTGKVITPEPASLGFCFQANSSLLILNPYPSEFYGKQLPSWLFTTYYRLVDDELELIKKEKTDFIGSCTES